MFSPACDAILDASKLHQLASYLKASKTCDKDYKMEFCAVVYLQCYWTLFCGNRAVGAGSCGHFNALELDQYCGFHNDCNQPFRKTIKMRIQKLRTHQAIQRSLFVILNQDIQSKETSHKKIVQHDKCHVLKLDTKVFLNHNFSRYERYIYFT